MKEKLWIHYTSGLLNAACYYSKLKGELTHLLVLHDHSFNQKLNNLIVHHDCSANGSLQKGVSDFSSVFLCIIPTNKTFLSLSQMQRKQAYFLH